MSLSVELVSFVSPPCCRPRPQARNMIDHYARVTIRGCPGSFWRAARTGRLARPDGVIERGYVDKGYLGHRAANPSAPSSPAKSTGRHEARTATPLRHRGRDRTPTVTSAAVISRTAKAMPPTSSLPSSAHKFRTRLGVAPGSLSANVLLQAFPTLSAPRSTS